MEITNLIVETLRGALVPNAGAVALHEPLFCGNERKYVLDCLDSTFVSSVGRYVDQFELELAAYTGAKHAVAVVNGTAALHIALKLAGVQEGDEVLMPALTFVATANAVAYCGAVPHFIDSEESTLGLDAKKLRAYLAASTCERDGHCVNRSSGRVIRALVPMHTFGHPSDLEGLLALARDFKLALVEDAAESLGSFYCGQHTGTFGLLGTLSFNGNKTITTGGGGAILTNDSELARHAKHLTTTAKKPHQWAFEHDELGYNYRMPNINAALGCAQLNRISDFLRSKRRLYERYKNLFSKISGVKLFEEPKGCQSNYWLQTLILDPEHAFYRDAILTQTNNLGIMTRPAWTLMSELPIYETCPKMDLQTAKSLSARIINIPSSVKLAS
jgi:aminotransferase in exopolysaccharide biosynthesis